MSNLLSVLLPVLMVPCVIVGIVLIVVGLVGRMVLSEPRCVQCQFDLRRSDGVYERCPECGLDLEGGRRIRFGKRRRMPRITALGVVFVLGGPLVAVIAGRAMAAQFQRQATLARTGAMIGPFNLPALDNPTVVARLAETWDQPWVWDEIERRRTAGLIDAAQIREAVVGVVEAIETAEPTLNNTVHMMAFGEDARNAWRNADIIDDELEERLFFATIEPTVHAFSRVSAGTDLEFTVRCLTLRGALVAVTEVQAADGTSLPIAYSRRSPTGVSLATTGVKGRVTLDLPPGKHTVVFNVVIGRLDRVSTDAYQQTRPPALADWPERITRREQTIETTVTVVPKDEPLIPITTDPTMVAAIRKTLLPEGVSATRREGRGTQLRVVRSATRHQVANSHTAIAVDVIVRSGELEWIIGDLCLTANGSSGGTTTVDASALNATTVDVIYRPKPSHAARMSVPEGDMVWGEDVVFEDVPVTWFGAPRADP